MEMVHENNRVGISEFWVILTKFELFLVNFEDELKTNLKINFGKNLGGSPKIENSKIDNFQNRKPYEFVKIKSLTLRIRRFEIVNPTRKLFFNPKP